MNIRDRTPLYLDLASNNAELALEESGWSFTESEPEARLIWRRKHYGEAYGRIRPDQALNHIPHEGCLANKGRLAGVLYGVKAAESFYPTSYCLYKEKHVKKLLSEIPEGVDNQNPWLTKIGSSGRGKGISIWSDFDEVRGWFNNPEKLTFFQEEKVAFQRYIKAPLLIDGRKSSVRAYFLVASLDPFLVYFYQDGSCKISTEQFRMDDYDDLTVHLTNSSKQKSQAEYDPEKFKISYEAMEKRIEQPWFADQLRGRLQECISVILGVSRERLCTHEYQGQFYAMLGSDWVLDRTGNPWLTEIQKGPGMKFRDPLKRKLIPALLDESLQIVAEIMERKRSGTDFKQLKSLNRYVELIGP